MAEKAVLACVAALLACAVCACGQKGPLYLPDATGEVVTRPAATPPSSENTEAPNSPQTPDSPPAPASPAPEVTEPGEEKDKDAAQPPPK